MSKLKTLLGFIILLSLSIVGCSSDNNTDNVTNLGNYAIQIKDAELFEAWEGDNSIKIIADFTNNSDTEQSFAFSGIVADAFQDGTTLDRLPTGISGLESMNEMIAPGETMEIAFGFSLVDDTNSVELEVQDFLGGSSEILSQTIDISKISE